MYHLGYFRVICYINVFLNLGILAPVLVYFGSINSFIIGR